VKIRQLVQDSLGPADLPVLLRETVAIKGLDRRLDGIRVGQVSDVHVGGTLGPDHLQRALSLFGNTPPDILTATGDLLDDPRLTRAALDVLAARGAPYGTFYSLGNHENFVDRDLIISTGRAHGRVQLLVNESVDVNVQGARVNLSGVDFPVEQGATGPRTPENHAFVAAATQRVDKADLRVCLAHHPDDFDQIATRGVELTLSGHTHGGQVAPLGGLVARSFKYFLGRYQVGDSHLHVSGGTGHSFPLRVGVPMEVTELTLRRV
jgi:predicted MPP superfamily phosphohydrolase